MSRRLTTDQVATLFFGRYQETGDAQKAALAVYEAGLTSGEEALQVLSPTPRHCHSLARIRSARISAAPIVAAVARFCGVSVDDISAHGHGGMGKVARFYAVWLLRKRVPVMPFPDIANVINRDHSTAVSSWHRVEKWIAASPALRDELLGLLPGAEPVGLRRVA